MKKVENTNNTPSPEPSQHERLCALLLGELEGPDAAKLEAQLEGSAELRAERDRIAATIGLLRESRAGSEALPPEFVATLERAAAPAPAAPSLGAQPTGTPWYARTPMKLAAGIAALAGGVLGGQALMQGELATGPRPASREELAQLRRDNKDSGVGDMVGEVAGVLGSSNEDFPDGIAQGAVIATDLSAAQVSAIEDMLQREGKGIAGAKHGAEFRAQTQGGLEELGKNAAAVERAREVLARTQNKQQPTGGGAYKGPGDVNAPAQGSDSFFLGRPGGAPSVTSINIDKAPSTESLFRTRADSAVVDGPTYGLGSKLGYLGQPTNSSEPGGAVVGVARVTVPSTDAGVQLKAFSLPQDTSTATPELAAAEKSLERARKKVAASGPGSPGPSGPSTPSSAATPPARGLVAGLGGGGGAPAPPTEGVPVVAEFLDALGYAGADVRGRHEHFYGDTSPGLEFSFDRNDSGRVELTPAQIDELCERRTQRILQDCRRKQGERPRDMFFRFWGDNPYVLARLDNQSTFGVDVDTASYALARRTIHGGNLPEKAQIRTEEFVNYFKPDLAPPTEGVFAIHTELAPSRFGNAGDAPSQRWMLRVGVRGKEVAAEERKPLALTFVVDTSGSMKEGQRLELVKHALRLLVSQMHPGDSIAIVGFNNSAGVILPMTSAQSRGVIEAAIYGLQPNGGTNAEGGLKLGYEVASAGLTTGAHNRVVLLSDGVANIGQTDQDRINGDVQRHRDSGIYLNTIGVGMNNHNDAFLEQLANKGDGICNYVDSSAEARRALVDNFTGAFEPIARDVKIQVEFDKSQVYRYRLLGYENRAIADADFRNDAVDAGEVGAGHQVVALYELELTGGQTSEPLATVRLRWKEPTGPGRDPLEDGASEVEQPVTFNIATTWEAAPAGYRRSAIVAQFAEILRRSVHARSDSLDELIAETSNLVAQTQEADLIEFLSLLQTGRALILQNTPKYDDLTSCIDSIRRNRILRAQYEELRKSENLAVLTELERANDELERRIEELIRNEIQGQLR